MSAVAAAKQVFDDVLPTRHSRLTALLALLLLWTVGWGYWLPDHAIWAGERNLEGVLIRPGSRASATNPTYDVVVSLYNEDLKVMAETVDRITYRLKGSKRVIVYSKFERNETELAQMFAVADEVIPLPNIGREGETYLHHITRHYETAETNIADFTLFLQPHLAWHWLMLPRVENIKHDTGFMSFGPYKQKNCTHDSQGLGFPRMADIYSAFQGDMCPPGNHLSTWAGQFVVSRKRILDNPLRNYQNLLALFHAPEDHWIWKEAWWNHGPSNPTLGHVLERSWPVIFNCIDAEIAKTCQNHEPSCQCSD